ncbi:MAG: phospholipid carrier-dependent glycosyltransferase [Alphaproteobacteria bacterium]
MSGDEPGAPIPVRPSSEVEFAPPAPGEGEGLDRGPSTRWLAAIGLVVLVFVYLSRLGGFPLQDPDEGRYAEIPREMVELDDWVTPRLDYVRYFEKPPLLYWLTGACFQAFGQTEAAARLVPALSGIASVVATWAIGRSMLGARGGLLAAAMLATSPLFFVIAQFLLIDLLLVACMTAALGALWGAHVSARKESWAIAAALATALGVLAKGPVALVLVGAIALSFLLASRDWATLRSLLRPAPLAAFVLVAVPWFVVVSLRNPEFPHAFFVREHFQRFTSDEVGHPEGPLFYLPILLGGPLPWTLLLVLAGLGERGRASFSAMRGDARLFCGLWAAIVVLFFSAARSKLPTYVLPAFPPLALLGAAALDGALDDRATRQRGLGWTASLLAGIGALLALAGLLALPLAGRIAERIVRDPGEVRLVAISVLGCGLALAATGAWVRGGLGAGRTWASLVAGLSLGVGLALLSAIGAREVVHTGRELARAIHRETRPGDRPLVATYRKIIQSLSFYLPGRVVLVDTQEGFNEIGDQARETGKRATAPHLWLGMDGLQSEWGSGRRAFVVTDARQAGELDVLRPTPRVLARHGKRVLLGNFPPGG